MNKSDQMDVLRNLDGSIEQHYEEKRGYTLAQFAAMVSHAADIAGVPMHRIIIDFDYDGSAIIMYKDIETEEERDNRLRELSKLQTGMKIWVAK